MRWLSAFFVLWAGLAMAQPADPAADSAPSRAPASSGTEVSVTQVGDEPEPTAPGSGAEAYDQKITALERRVNDLKEKVFRSKTRLAILKESVLSSTIAGAEAQIVHRNEMGGGFRLEKVAYSLDGTPIRTLVDKEGDLDGREEIEILSGPIVPGNHTLTVSMVYRGNGYGIFTYLRGYVFNLRSSHTFRAEEGRLVRVKAIGYEKGGIATDLKDRPDIKFESTFADAMHGAKTGAPDGTKAGPTSGAIDGADPAKN
jgi:hypothetical protein